MGSDTNIVRNLQVARIGSIYRFSDSVSQPFQAWLCKSIISWANLSWYCVNLYTVIITPILPNHKSPLTYRNTLKSLVVNCQSIYPKKEHFINLLHTNHPDLVFGCESWLSPTVHNAEIFPPDYTIYRHDREDGYGGVFLACHNTLTSHEIPYNGPEEIIACKIELTNGQSTIACCVYRPPNRSLDYLESVCRSLENIILSFPNDIIWIAGDFNLPDIDWNISCIAGSNYPLKINELSLDFTNTFGFSQLVNFPTRYNNILDIFLTNRPSLTNYCNSIPGISDHEAILTESNISVILHKPPSRKIFLWNRADPELVRIFFNRFSNQFLNT